MPMVTVSKKSVGRSSHRFCMDYIKYVISNITSCQGPKYGDRVNFSILPVSMLQPGSHSLGEKDILEKHRGPRLKIIFSSLPIDWTCTFSFLTSCWLEPLGKVLERHKTQSTELFIQLSRILCALELFLGGLLKYVTAK